MSIICFECMGVDPCLSCSATSAPASFNALIASTCPFCAAKCIGVHPSFLSCAATSAPASFNALIASTCPFCAAQCIGVHPSFLSCAATSAPASFNACKFVISSLETSTQSSIATKYQCNTPKIGDTIRLLL